VAQIVPLDEPERERITAVQILPGEPQGASAHTFRQPKRVEGGQVVRFLVDVHDVRGKIAHPPGQSGIKVKVKIAVKGKGFDDQLVPGGVRSFQVDQAAAVVPRGRHGDHQLDIGKAGDFLQFALIGAHQTGFGDHQDSHTCSVNDM
jgi:hypothetical protein